MRLFMENELILDSCVWIAYLDKDDLHHEKASGVFALLKERVILPEYIVLEICTFLIKKKRGHLAREFIYMALKNDALRFLSSDPEQFFSFMCAFQEQKIDILSFVDASLLFLSKTYRVLTFDKELEKAITSC